MELYHASKYGNGAEVTGELRRLLGAQGHNVVVQHVNRISPGSIPQADLYIFGFPGRIERPIGGMRRFMSTVNLPPGPGMLYSPLSLPPRPDKRGRMPTEDEIACWQRVQPLTEHALKDKALKKVEAVKVYVNDMKAPLKDRWQRKVEQPPTPW